MWTRADAPKKHIHVAREMLLEGGDAIITRAATIARTEGCRVKNSHIRRGRWQNQKVQALTLTKLIWLLHLFSAQMQVRHLFLLTVL